MKQIYDYDKFSVDHETGQVRTTEVFDRESKSEYYIMVVAEDGAKSDRPNHYPPGTPNQGIKLTVIYQGINLTSSC